MVGCKSTAHFSTLFSTINRRIIRCYVSRVQNVVKRAQTPRFLPRDCSNFLESQGPVRGLLTKLSACTQNRFGHERKWEYFNNYPSFIVQN